MSLTPQIESVLSELEVLDTTFSVPASTEGYESVWTPDGTIRLWSVPRQTGVMLYDLVVERRPKTILELGTSSGYSAIWMALAAQTYGGHIYTVEVAAPKIAMAQDYFARTGVSESVTVLPGMVHDVLRTWNQPIDMVFMDADKHNYLSYFNALLPYLSPNAVVVADNVLDYGYAMQDFLDLMNTSSLFQTTVHEIDHGVMVAKRLV